jgi:hypothetical protein
MQCVQVGEQWFVDAVSIQGEVFQGTQLPAASPSLGFPSQPDPFSGAPSPTGPPQIDPPPDPQVQPPGDPSTQP